MKGQIEVEINGEMLEAPFRIHQSGKEDGMMFSTGEGDVCFASKDNVRMWIDGKLVFDNTQ